MASRSSSAFRQGDVTKAIKAAVAAGVDIARIEIARDGRIVIIAGNGKPEGETMEVNDWDRV